MEFWVDIQKKQLDDWNRKESYSWKYFAQKMEFSIKHFFS